MLNKISGELIKKRIGQIIFLFFVLYIISLLQSCSAEKQVNYHLKQSARHYKKAIKKGHVPLIEVNTLNSSIKMELTNEFKTELPATILNVLNESEQFNELNEEEKTKIIDRFITIIKEVPRHINIDTTLVLHNSKGDSIGFLAMQTVNGDLRVKQLYIDNETIIVEQTLYQHTMSALGLNTWWKRGLFWLLIAIVVALYVYKKVMPGL